ncbi:GNAT family N-acetyltransferase [Kurthia huakuii]|uniref:GNAT family N-acetyltransferase n=1 Tax=Kurthia huakuii TaxID=1421019 RepID=UPI000495BFFD|nr:GNAT family protein [Kurthia huakuii]MBM7699804.1 ribosomal-protein-alanine N-acetyltransferase [Kurthia huakuii]
MLPTLETPRLRLRQVTAADFKGIQQFATDDDVTTFLVWDTHQSLNETEAFLNELLKKYEHGSLIWGIMVKENDRLVGIIEFSEYRRDEKIAEMSCVIAKSYWKNDYASEATQALIRYGFSELKLERIQASYFSENISSERVLQKAGLFYEGTQRRGKFVKGRYHDVKLYAILRSDLGY